MFVEFTKQERMSLGRVYANLSEDHGFGSFYDFLSWCEGKYLPRCRTLYKIRENKPHGPDNSYWYYSYSRGPENAAKSPYCEKCGKSLPLCNTVGCPEYRKWFINNWNQHICIKPKEKDTNAKEYFTYEHPDLVREGILWSG